MFCSSKSEMSEVWEVKYPPAPQKAIYGVDEDDAFMFTQEDHNAWNRYEGKH